MSAVEERKIQFFSLMERYVRLGMLLDENLDWDDEAAVAETKTLLAEMHQIRVEIEAFDACPCPLSH